MCASVVHCVTGSCRAILRASALRFARSRRAASVVRLACRSHSPVSSSSFSDVDAPPSSISRDVDACASVESMAARTRRIMSALGLEMRCATSGCSRRTSLRCRQPLSLASLVSREGARLVDIDESDDVDVPAASGSSDADARKAASARVARSAREMTASSAAALRDIARTPSGLALTSPEASRTAPSTTLRTLVFSSFPSHASTCAVSILDGRCAPATGRSERSWIRSPSSRRATLRSRRSPWRT